MESEGRSEPCGIGPEDVEELRAQQLPNEPVELKLGLRV